MRKLYKSDILSRAKFIPDLKKHIVYFLIKDDEVVYVGYSSFLIQRLANHTYDKDFNKYFTIVCKTIDEAQKLELSYIQELKPFYNKFGNSEHNSPSKIKKNSITKRNIQLTDLHKPYIAERINKVLSISNDTYSKLGNNYLFKVEGFVFTAPKGKTTYKINEKIYREPTSFLGKLDPL